MKICQKCGQPVADEVMACPACGGEVVAGRLQIDDYEILEVVHEGYSSTLCRARKRGTDEQVAIRIFTPQSGVDDEIAYRLKLELGELQTLPADCFVQHRELTQSSDGLWYRVSEWVQAEDWGEVVRSGFLNNLRNAFGLFHKIARNLQELHQTGHFIPHLILSDIMLIRGEGPDYQVKIDYKISRFLDPALDRPSGMLKRLLECHPDIVNGRPLNFKSDIWSLGKIFIELLSANYETCDYAGQIEKLPLPKKARILFKTMLAEAPELRPNSMAEVASALALLRDSERPGDVKRRRERAMAPIRLLRQFQKKVYLTAAALIIALLVGAVYLLQWGPWEKKQVTLEEYANLYAPSIGYILVSYFLKLEKKIVYRKVSQGTVFLVGNDGYLLTSRHVVCPWLEDPTYLRAIRHFQQQRKTLSFGYQLYLWFEGQKAFKRFRGLPAGADLADYFFLETAYRSQGTPAVRIAGVARPVVGTRQVAASPLKDDFAVLKIDRLPPNAKPLPLASDLVVEKIPKLSDIIILGFPLGRRGQEQLVSSSATRGNVRRSFQNLINVDASLYKGNSGGPVIDRHGRVIGIASAFLTEPFPIQLPMLGRLTTPMRNMALVLPINKAAVLLAQIRAGQVKWDGVLDPQAGAKLKMILEPAGKGLWAMAQQRAKSALQDSRDPRLFLAGGIVSFCQGDYKTAGERFERTLSLDAKGTPAQLMLLTIDWLAGKGSTSPYGRELLALDWKSDKELQGYLARVLAGMVEPAEALKGWYSLEEKSWLDYMVALKRQQSKDRAGAERLLREALLAADPSMWQFYLAKARLEQVQKEREESISDRGRRAQYKKDQEAFANMLAGALKAKQKSKQQIGLLISSLGQKLRTAAGRRSLLMQIIKIEPHNRYHLKNLAYLLAIDENWAESLKYARAFLGRPGRENRARLSLGLLEALLLGIMGRKDQAQASLKKLAGSTRDGWHKKIIAVLRGQRTNQALQKEAGASVQKMLTAHTALGLWMEGAGKKEAALNHYRMALETLLDDWPEYELAKARVIKLRKTK